MKEYKYFQCKDCMYSEKVTEDKGLCKKYTLEFGVFPIINLNEKHGLYCKKLEILKKDENGRK